MRTKIVCSIGPATDSEEMLRKMIEGGMDIARLNFSHDAREVHMERIDRIRKIASELGKKVQILCDLQGPKIRIAGDSNDAPRKLNDGETVTLATHVCPDITPDDIVIDDPYLHGDVSVSDVILIDDGIIELEVTGVEGCRIICKVINGGDLYSRKGVNLPLTTTTTSSLTDKDKADLALALTKNPDWIAISFVQTKEDVLNVRNLMGDSKARVMCKIERANAIDNLNEIIDETDGIMVARGDLGVEIPVEKLPIVQKRIIRLCYDAGKPVVTATQMLASMTKIPYPSRAEVTDIANAVFDGTDAVMMSNETTVGQYPVQALHTMRKVAKEAENYLFRGENTI